MRDLDDFISWSCRAPISILAKKEAVLRRIHPVRVQKGRAVTPRDRSQSNVSATFRFRVAVCRVHKGSPFKYVGMKFNPQHPFPAQLCLVATIGATSGSGSKEQRSCELSVYVFLSLNLCKSLLVGQTV